jgi:hypothetical protein
MQIPLRAARAAAARRRPTRTHPPLPMMLVTPLTRRRAVPGRAAAEPMPALARERTLRRRMAARPTWGSTRAAHRAAQGAEAAGRTPRARPGRPLRRPEENSATRGRRARARSGATGFAALRTSTAERDAAGPEDLPAERSAWTYLLLASATQAAPASVDRPATSAPREPHRSNAAAHEPRRSVDLRRSLPIAGRRYQPRVVAFG